MNKSINISLAGSTYRTAQCAQALLDDPDFSIPWIMTPKPKPIGRKKIITKNPLHVFAEENSIQVILIDKKIDDRVETLCKASQGKKKPDFLLVVDFGYIIPDWLLNLPTIAPLNIHPSELPKWRGSSPAQFSILYGDKKSAVTLMVMNNKLDQGPIIHQEHFDVDPNWNSEDYYQHSFDLICKVLPQKVKDYNAKRITHTAQPTTSPTPIAKKLTKQDAFIEWEVLKSAMGMKTNAHRITHTAQQLDRATKAFSPWPLLWTIVSTDKGEKRMQILDTELGAQGLALRKVRIEGQKETTWNEIKDQIHI